MVLSAGETPTHRFSVIEVATPFSKCRQFKSPIFQVLCCLGHLTIFVPHRIFSALFYLFLTALFDLRLYEWLPKQSWLCVKTDKTV